MAFACDHCHAIIDQGKDFTNAQRVAVWTRGHMKTWPILIRLLLGIAKEKRPRLEAPRGTALTSSKIVPRPYA